LFVGHQYREFVEVRVAGALWIIVYKLVFFVIVIYISGRINRFNKVKRLVISIFDGILSLDSREYSGKKGLN